MLYSFVDTYDGSFPFGDLTYLNGMLFGTTEFGGPHQSDGTVFSFKP